MRRMYLLIPVLVLVMMVATPTAAQVTIGASTPPASSYNSGNIYVASSPSGASATIDGTMNQLFTPGTFSGVPPGQYTVQVARPGYQTSITTVNVSTGTTQNVIVTLDPAYTTGGLSVSSTPKGVGVYVDETYVGKTNLIVGNLAPGSHRLEVVEPGYQAWFQTVAVPAQQVIPITVTLVPEVNASSGDLQITSDPSGAFVYLNGAFRGFTVQNDNFDINDLTPGTYTVTLTRVGYQDYTSPVTITAGQITRISPVLQPSAVKPTTASTEIVSDPSGAAVFINGVQVGFTPISFQNVTPGSYTVELRLAGYNPYTSSGQVQAGQDIRVVASLSPVTPVTTPTPTKASASPVTIALSLGVLCLAGYLINNRRRV